MGGLAWAAVNTRQEWRFTLSKIQQNSEHWRLAAFHDAGWATRQGLHSQAGAAIFVADKSVPDGQRGKAMMIEWVSSKIPGILRIRFEAEINSAQVAPNTQG